jgi:metal-sulfur cluster biosynthetic enzyme
MKRKTAKKDTVKKFDEKNEFFGLINEVIDPEVGIGIADMGLIYGVKKHGNIAVVTMTLTSMGCPAGPYMIEEIQRVFKEKDMEAQVEIVWEPAWNPDMMKSELREMMFGY